MRLTEQEAALFSELSENSGLQLSEIVRRLLHAAVAFYADNDGWPREIAVVKKSRDGADVQPAANSATFGTQVDKGQTRSLPPKRAFAGAKAATK